MKRLTLLPLLLTLLACGSSKDQFGLAKTNFLSDCQHGNVEIMVGLSGQGTTGEDRSDPMTFNVEVANNSRADIIVRSIRIDVRPSETIAYRLDNTYREFNQTIAENEEHVFELPTSGHGAPTDPRTERRGSTGIEVVASVRLEGGDEYRCRYQVPGPQ